MSEDNTTYDSQSTGGNGKDLEKPASFGNMQVKSTSFQIQVTTFKELWWFAETVSKTDFAPQGLRDKPGACFMAIQYGLEIGISPMQALQNIAVINSRPTLWGDAMLALILSHKECKDVTEEITEINGELVATCTVKRGSNSKNMRTTTRQFSQADAIQAGLWGKKGKNGGVTPWVTYPKRMLQMRARSWALRDAFADVLKGIIAREEATDIPVEEQKNVTPPVTESQEQTEQTTSSVPTISDAQHIRLEADIANQCKIQGLDGQQTKLFRERLKSWYLAYSEQNNGQATGHLNKVARQDLRLMLDKLPNMLSMFIGELPASDKQLAKLKRLLKERNIPLERCKTEGLTRAQADLMCKPETLNTLVHEINDGINQCVNTGEEETPLTPSEEAEAQAQAELAAAIQRSNEELAKTAQRRSEIALAQTAEREMDRYFRPPTVYHRANIAGALEQDSKKGY